MSHDNAMRDGQVNPALNIGRTTATLHVMDATVRLLKIVRDVRRMRYETTKATVSEMPDGTDSGVWFG